MTNRRRRAERAEWSATVQGAGAVVAVALQDRVLLTIAEITHDVAAAIVEAGAEGGGDVDIACRPSRCPSG